MIRCTKEEINEPGSEIWERRLSWKTKGIVSRNLGLACVSQTNTYAQFQQTHNYCEKEKKDVVQMFVLYLCNHSYLTFGGNSQGIFF